MRLARQVLLACVQALVAVSVLAVPIQAVAQLVISEFRVRGPSGANDEYVVITNPGTASHTVTSISGTGYGLAASDGVTRFTIPNGTVIPGFGSWLGVNTVGYSLGSYPAGNGTTATGDSTFTTDIPDNAGIALFNDNTGGGSYTLANRIDAVGSTTEANALYKEGAGYPALVAFSIDYAFQRDLCGKGGSITTSGFCPGAGIFKDTNNNAADFIFVDTNGTSAGAGQRLGAPGPRNLSSPIMGGNVATSSLDGCVSAQSPPNIVRDFTSDPANNSTFGTIDVRRSFTNLSGGNITRLRFRVVDETTFPAPSGFADLRIRTSTSAVVSVDRPPCGAGVGNVTVQGTTLEQPPSSPNGSAFGASVSVGTITLGTPLANGASVDVRFLFGIQQTGKFRIGLIIEGLPKGGSQAQMLYVEGCTDGCPLDRATDFNNDQKSDILYRNIATGQVYRLLMNGFSVTNGTLVYTEPNLDWKIVAEGDFNGDNINDLVWRNSTTGQVFIQTFDSSGLASTGAIVYTEPNAAWKILGAPDIDGDGMADLLWWNSSTGQVFVMLMNGLNIKAQGLVYTEANTTWKIVATGDMDGVRAANRLVWHNSVTGQVYLQRLTYQNGAFSQTGLIIGTEPNTSWNIIATPDLDGDGKSDLLWRNQATGQVYGMLMNGNSIGLQNFIYTSSDLAWKIVAVGDYNGDGKSDLLWRNESTGQLWMMQMNGLAIGPQAGPYFEPNLNWRTLGPWEYGIAAGTLP